MLRPRLLLTSVSEDIVPAAREDVNVGPHIAAIFRFTIRRVELDIVNIL